MRVHARLSFIVTTNLPSFVRLIRCFIGRSKPLGRLEEFGQAVFDKEVKIQRSPGTPSKIFSLNVTYSTDYALIQGKHFARTTKLHPVNVWCGKFSHSYQRQRTS